MKQTKDIIFVTISMGGGGTERVISLLANHYASEGKKVAILMIASDDVQYDINPAIEVISLSQATDGSLSKRIKRIGSMRKYFSKNKSNKIIAMGTVAAIFTLLSTIGLKRDIVISERNDPNRLNHKPISNKMKMVRNLLYRRANMIAVQTKDVIDALPENLHNRCKVIPNPLSDSLPAANIDGVRNKTVISAGRLTEQKNHKLLIDAFHEFSNNNDYTLNIYGKGELESELKNYVDSLNMSDRIHIMGFCDNLYEKLLSEGIYVSSSNWEGISNSLLEALALGIPTIATDCPVGGSRMFINNMENGILIPVDDKQSLIDSLQQIASNNSLAKKLSVNASKIRDTLSVEKIAKLWLM